MANVEKSFDEYPSLIYDGPFSEHIENREPALLKNAHTISQEDALNTAEKFVGTKGLAFESLSENRKGAFVYRMAKMKRSMLKYGIIL